MCLLAPRCSADHGGIERSRLVGLRGQSKAVMEQLNRFARWLGAAEDEEGAVDEDPFLLEESEEAREQQIESLLQRFSVLLEYERLQDLVPSGIYVMPSLDSVLTWHGVLFARQGLYRGGVFKFQLLLPDDYPESAPELRFISEVFHPMVEPDTGRVDLGAFFPEWRAGRDYASFALPHLHRALLRREYFAGSARAPLNPEARELFIEDPASFAERAAECARASVRRAYDNVPGSPLHFSTGPTEAHKQILEQLHVVDNSFSLEDRTAMFVEWFCEHYSHEQHHVRLSQQEAEMIQFEADADDAVQVTGTVPQSSDAEPEEAGLGANEPT